MLHSETEKKFIPEQRETREGQEDKELQAAAAMERADFLTKEVKTSQNQIQNIVLHMQAVIAAIKELRKKMDLPEVSSTESSVQEDKRQVDQLRVKISEYKTELLLMKEELVKEYLQKIQEAEPGITLTECTAKANMAVEKIYADLEIV